MEKRDPNQDETEEETRRQLSEKSSSALNKIANLYLNAVYLYGFICAAIETDPNLEEVFQIFSKKTIQARKCAQVRTINIKGYARLGLLI